MHQGLSLEGGLEELPLCWIEAVLQLGDAVEELIISSLACSRVVGIPAECMVFCSWGAYLRSRIKQSRKSGIKSFKIVVAQSCF